MLSTTMKMMRQWTKAATLVMVVMLVCMRTVNGFVLNGVQAFVTTTNHPKTVVTPPSLSSTCLLATSSIDTRFMWNAGLSFGKGDFAFYSSFDRFMRPFPQQDRDANPDIFNLPTGVYEVALPKPLGIVFEEIESGRGLYVQELVDGGNADKLGGIIKPGDVLVGMTAVKIVGAKYERRLIPARTFDFDTMVGAVESNAPKFGCDDVVMMFEKPDVANAQDVQSFMSFFEPPFDNPWKQRQ